MKQTSIEKNKVLARRIKKASRKRLNHKRLFCKTSKKRIFKNSKKKVLEIQRFKRN